MIQKIKLLSFSFVTLLIGFGVGLLLHPILFPSRVQGKVIYKTEVKWVPIKENYDEMTRTDLQKELFRYNEDAPSLEVRRMMNEEKIFYRSTASLYKRSWYRDFEIEGDSGGPGWKLTAEIGLVGLGTGFYAGYKMGIFKGLLR